MEARNQNGEIVSSQYITVTTGSTTEGLGHVNWLGGNQMSSDKLFVRVGILKDKNTVSPDPLSHFNE